jgi:hypothetical protein
MNSFSGFIISEQLEREAGEAEMQQEEAPVRQNADDQPDLVEVVDEESTEA